MENLDISSSSPKEHPPHDLVDSASMETVCFLMPAVGQPRWSKRIDMVKAEGLKARALAFDRDYHRGRLPDCEVTTLGAIKKGEYLKRLWVYVRAVPTLRRHTRHASAVYAFGLDLALLAMLANIFRRLPVFLEVGDIRPIQVAPGLMGKCMKFISQKTFNASKLLVVTAEDFATGYYADNNISDTPWQVIENKLDLPRRKSSGFGTVAEAPVSVPASLVSKSVANADGTTPTNISSDVLNIGYFGVLRSPWSFVTLATYAKENANSVKITLAGALQEGHEEFEQLIALGNVEYLGAYRSPDDLPHLYQQVDLVWGCYPEPSTQKGASDENWLWAQAVCRSNRFYECCYYRVPIISMASSADGHVVESYGLGPLLHSYDYKSIKENLEAITTQQILVWRENLEKLPEPIYCYTTEAKELAQIILQQINTARDRHR